MESVGEPGGWGGTVAGMRFLLCHSVIQHIMGSTVVALELAEHLAARGADVTVWAATIRDPMRSAFVDAGVRLIDHHEDEPPSLDDFDWVWVHSQALPPRFIDQLAEPERTRIPRFVFHHMAASDVAPDEHPYIAGLEAALSSVSTFVSPRTQHLLEGWLPAAVPQRVFANPAPAGFARVVPRTAGEVRRVLVVSNHPPHEVLEAARILRTRGIDVDVVGQHQEAYRRITPRDLEDVDAVITIGKSVQYCLVASVPVYVYDHFGGYGYLDDDTLALAQHRNFSGRGGETRSAEVIADEVVAGIGRARDFHAAHREEFCGQYGLDAALETVVATAVERVWRPLTPATVGPWRSAQMFGARYYRAWADELDHVFARERLEDEVRLARAREDDAFERAVTAEAEVEAVRASRSYRVGNLVMRPLAAARVMMRRAGAGDATP